jgi:uncharacterized OB-fold protein
MSQAAVAPTPTTKGAVAFLKIPKEGAPYLAGAKCRNCGEVYVGDREVCGKCFARGKMDSIKLADKGKLYNFTVVHRNFPGVPVPFISAIVDLDGGGTLKGNLLGVEPAYRRFGIGRRLVEWLEETARVGGMFSVRLEVRAGQTGSRTFYRRLGYQEDKYIPGYYSGREAAVRMTHDLRRTLSL